MPSLEIESMNKPISAEAADAVIRASNPPCDPNLQTSTHPNLQITGPQLLNQPTRTSRTTLRR
jgi:hypothetical protein